jgi:hypothetical protein
MAGIILLILHLPEISRKQWPGLISNSGENQNRERFLMSCYLLSVPWGDNFNEEGRKLGWEWSGKTRRIMYFSFDTNWRTPYTLAPKIRLGLLVAATPRLRRISDLQ